MPVPEHGVSHLPLFLVTYWNGQRRRVYAIDLPTARDKSRDASDEAILRVERVNV